MEKVSFVIPCYKSEHTIEKVVNEIAEVMSESDYDTEVILVNDGSPGNVWDVISNLSSPLHIVGVNLAKNFGQASAIMAGYANATGDYIITMDDDGQSPVDESIRIIETLKAADADVVYGVCNETQFNVFRKIGSRINGIMSNRMFGLPKDRHIVSFYVMTGQIKNVICKYDLPYTYISGLVFRATKRVAYLEVSHRARMEGESGYTFKKLLAAWLNGFTAFSIKPLRFVSILGIVVAFAGFLSCIGVAVYKCVVPNVNTGWASVIGVILLVGGANLVVQGLVGEYIGRMYMCINKTPQYVIHDVKKLYEED